MSFSIQITSYLSHTTSGALQLIGRVKKLLVVSNVVGAKGDLKTFGRYVYNVRRQFQELRHLKDCLPTGEVIIHENFAENFQLKH